MVLLLFLTYQIAKLRKELPNFTRTTEFLN